MKRLYNLVCIAIALTAWGCKETTEEAVSFTLDNPTLTQYTLAGTGESVTVGFKCGTSWSASIDYETGSGWLRLSPEKGDGSNRQFSIRAEENTADGPRKATIVVQAGGKDQCWLTVIQPDNSLLDIAQKEFDVAVEGELIVIDLTINRPVVATPSAEWIVENDPDRSNETRMLVYRVEPNPGPTVRTGTIEITAGSRTEIVTIRQEGKETLAVDKTTFPTFDQPGGTLQLTITSNNAYTVEMPGWITQNGEPSDTGAIDFRVAANDTPAKRTGAIVIRSESGNLSETVRITQERGPMILRMLTYNVHNGIGTDEVKNFQRIATVIADQNPDIVALQELDSMTQRNPIFVLKELADKSAMPYYVYGPTIPYQTGKYGVGLLSREKPISSFQVTIPSERETRTALFVEFEEYWFCCTHFPLSEEERTKAAEIVCTEAAKLSKPVLLGGDLNATPYETCIRVIIRKVFTPFNNLNDFTYPAQNPNFLADYLMGYTAGGRTFEVIQQMVVNEPLASDHRPFFAAVRF